jgi:alkanesulfonate monooxygenase SsuD/methylene tetrahydromethanopterin reductase-like flavin-dependent oxidoreductase (luciferase family)
MIFDLFHSIGRIDSLPERVTDAEVFRGFFAQAALAEELGFSRVWVAESHFSSEVQKRHREPVIPNYQGEVGLNADSFQLAQYLFAKTKKIGFGTAILNIVGGNGGPIAAADRVRSLAFFNSLSDKPREVAIGVASGRFPYINAPFGIVPRDGAETALWNQYKNLIFIEALEIFLRLVNGETFSSAETADHEISTKSFKDPTQLAAANAALAKVGVAEITDSSPHRYAKRWQFEALKLVPELVAKPDWFRIVLGSTDPTARRHGLKFFDMDIFNLSFTPPDQLRAQHEDLTKAYGALGHKWHRARMPRTVLVFIDKNENKALEMASQCFDTYIEAMRGTVQLPPKSALMERALIGDPVHIREQLAPNNPNGFEKDDRLMLWFEFNQTDQKAIAGQMRLFQEQVIAKLG